MDGQAIAMPVAVDEPPQDVAARVGALFDLHHQRLFRLARRLSGSAEDARDLVQETFLRAARSPASIPVGTSHEEAWLVRVLINICRDRWRQDAVRKRARVNGTVAAEPAYNPEPHLIAHSLVRQALELLAPRRRAILLMYELEGTSIPSIAKLLGINAVTVRWHLSVGRREMAKLLELGSKPSAGRLANERASEPTRAERGSRGPASERVGESEGRSPSE